MSNGTNADAIREEWLNRLNALFDETQEWAQDFGWATKRIMVAREDLVIGKYQAPALLVQENDLRGILEPVARFAPNVEGVVDLYIMPAYDDIASMFYIDGQWQVQYPGLAGQEEDDSDTGETLSREVFRQVLESMKDHALQ